MTVKCIYLLKTIQNNVETEHAFQEIDNERIDGRTGNEVKRNIRAWVVRREGQNTFFDIGLTNVNANSKKHQTVETILKKHKKRKRKENGL